VFPLSMLNSSGQTVTAMDGAGIPLAPYKYSLAQTPEQVAEFNTLLNYTLITLPEYRNQSNNKNLFPELETGGSYDFERYNVILNQAATVDVSFVYEGAGYHNSLGYFTFDPANPPTRASLMSNGSANKVMVDGIIFPNASLFNSGGSNNGLYTGDSMKLTFNDLASYAWNQGKDCTVAGNCKLGVGFFLVADGFQRVPSAGISTNGGVRSSPNPDWVFYSLRDLNPEVNTVSNPDISQHTVLLKVPNTNLYAIGFEDMNRTPGGSTDHDFNDVVYRLSVTPTAAFSNSAKVYSQVALDTDRDGVPDSVDEFPFDAQRASSNWYPSSSAWNTLAYEDAWPSHGDYDMNDLVVQYRYRLIRNAAGKVKELELTYQLAAAGAANHSGFGVELTGISKATPLDYARLRVNGGSVQTIAPDVTNNLVFRIFSDALSELGGASLINTVTGGTMAALKTYQLNVAFTTALASSAFTYGPPYNPFLFATSAPGTEVHLPGHQPSSGANAVLFGSKDDNTSVAAQRYYVDPKGLPWALDLPAGWKWPTERTDIVTAYPSFQPWVESGGTTNTNWYSAPLAGKTY
jgi:LruC domain-containing protein